MKKIIMILLCFVGIQVMAQEKMRITLNNGTTLDFHVSNVAEMNFYEVEYRNIVGEWLEIEKATNAVNYYKLNEDATATSGEFSSYSGLNCYNCTYTFDNSTIRLNILGTEIVYGIDSWENDNFTSTKGDLFLRVLDVYTMKDIDDPIAIGNDGDKILFAGNSCISIEDNKIKANKEGSGYMIVKDAVTSKYKAYRIDVTAAPTAPIDWTTYFKKSKEEIEAEFGVQHQTNETNNTFSYTKAYNSQISTLIFTFDKESNLVTKVMANFYDVNKMQSYLDYLADHYILIRETETSKTYYDAETSSEARVQISVSISDVLCYISYTDKSN